MQFHNFAPIVTMDLLPACMVAYLNEEFGNDSEPFMAPFTSVNNANNAGNNKNNKNNENDKKNEEDETDIVV